MLYMVTFPINIPQMLAYIPYMDPMGLSEINPSSHASHQKNAPRDDDGIHHIEPTRDLVGTKACGDVNLHSKPRSVRLAMACHGRQRVEHEWRFST